VEILVQNLLIKIKTARSLRLLNILKVFVYRIQCKTGYFEKRLPKKHLSNTPLFYTPNHYSCPDISEENRQKIKIHARQVGQGHLTFFSHASIYTGIPPNWFLNPFNKKIHRKNKLHWTLANDAAFGDIKIIWEMSRMDWALVLSKRVALSNSNQYVSVLNHWLNSWIDHNMPQTGPNWICAQETAIRLIHILLCAHILNQKKPLPALIDFVEAHCQRISLTRHYANAQQNNHAISEAAGLFIAGLWLDTCSQLHQKAIKWQTNGRYDLEWLVNKLIAKDGSFAQHSLNYHRLLISTLNMVEYFRQFFHAPAFSKRYYKKVTAALFWLYQMVDPETGNGPNMGANDGARVYALSEASYTDYRPEIQLGGCLFLTKKVYPGGDWDEPIKWLQLNPDTYPPASIKRTSCAFSDGGYVTFHGEFDNSVPVWGLVRCPNIHFRPHHADTLHLDLWVKGINIFRDSGSYSYDISDTVRTHFISSAAHNTVSFDAHDQMPVLSRFLYGQWIKARTVHPILPYNKETISWCGAYTDYMGCYHQRHILIDNKKWRIVDTLDRFNQNAVVRWRLMKDQWTLDKDCLTGTLITMYISANVNAEIKLTDGFESLFYMDKTKIPVLEIHIHQSPAIVVTEIARNDVKMQKIVTE
jgi:hypothetical protein